MNIKVLATLYYFIIAVSHVSVSSEYTDDDDGDEDDSEETTDLDLEESEYEITTESTSVNELPDEEWQNLAIRDIAYYLRAHKFNEFDRRYNLNEDTAPRNFFEEFPDPPLRSVHWEVRKYCELSFLDCVQYLHEKVMAAELRRGVDTATLMQENGWRLPDNATQIEEADKQCQKLRTLDWVAAQPFQGPLERLQWRTSASYYMCWFTVNEESSLTMFGEPCDNFANCLDPYYKNSNRDPRADDRLSFQCATYSFCPDPCCTQKHHYYLVECWNSDSNPCHEEAPYRKRKCGFNRTNNRDFESIVLNRWNVSCTCSKPGYEWDSRFGMCIDIDECKRRLHTCDRTSEACFNLPGSYKCGCQWGYLFDNSLQKCVRNGLLLAVEMGIDKNTTQDEKPTSLVKFLLGLFHKNAENNGIQAEDEMTIIKVILSNFIILFVYCIK